MKPRHRDPPESIFTVPSLASRGGPPPRTLEARVVGLREQHPEFGESAFGLDQQTSLLYVPVLFGSKIEGRIAIVTDVGSECDGRGQAD
jgi:hypothetical protein